jgi:hypothetical protein
MVAVSIVPPTLRDISFIAANVRPDDWREIACQIPDGTTPLDVALWSVSAGQAWVAKLDDQPVALFGASPQTAAGNVLALWAWGTKRMRRVAPAITRFVRDGRAAEWVEAGKTRVEARSIAGHVEAHRWLVSIGFLAEPLPQWGKDGEDFILFSMTLDRWRHVREQSQDS